MVTKLFGAVASCATLAASVAAAQPAVSWIEGPTVQEMAAAYPAKAKAAHVGGQVTLTCTLNSGGYARSCAALAEQPKGYGFGTAARKVAERLRASSTQGSVNNLEVEVPVTFAPEVLGQDAVLVKSPKWTALPSAQDFQATFPKAENGVNSVRVVLACTAKADGSLADCAVDREEPAGQGFGAGALALAPKFRVEAWSADGQPTTGARVRVPIRYQLTQVEQPAAAKP